jgi:sterol O-acyltransferase
VSEVFRRRKLFEKKLKQLDELESAASLSIDSPSLPNHASSYLNAKDIDNLKQRHSSVNSKVAPELQSQESDLAEIAAALESGTLLTIDQMRCFQRAIKDEIKSLDSELSGKSSNRRNCYPRNLNIRDFATYIPLPTVVYQLDYPRQDHINWFYVAEKAAATFGVLGVMHIVSQAYIYPVVVSCLEINERGMPIQQRLREFPWVVGELLFPLMLEYLLSWYVIWECIVSIYSRVTITVAVKRHRLPITFVSVSIIFLEPIVG